jgi:hypothetical protein
LQKNLALLRVELARRGWKKWYVELAKAINEPLHRSSLHHQSEGKTPFAVDYAK